MPNSYAVVDNRLLYDRISPYIRKAMHDVEVNVVEVNFSLRTDRVEVYVECPLLPELKPFLERNLPDISEDYHIDDFSIRIAPDDIVRVTITIVLRHGAALNFRNAVSTLFE